MSFRSDKISVGGLFDSTKISLFGSIDSSYDAANTSFAGANILQIMTLDTSVAASNDTEMIWTSTDYASSTRSSVRTESTGPRISLSPHTAETFQSSSYFSSHYQESPTMGLVVLVPA